MFWEGIEFNINSVTDTFKDLAYIMVYYANIDILNIANVSTGQPFIYS